MTAIKGLSVLLFNARRDLARRETDEWSPLVWDHATKLYAEHGSALIDALVSVNQEHASRLADSLLAMEPTS